MVLTLVLCWVCVTTCVAVRERGQGHTGVVQQCATCRTRNAVLGSKVSLIAACIKSAVILQAVQAAQQEVRELAAKVKRKRVGTWNTRTSMTDMKATSPE